MFTRADIYQIYQIYYYGLDGSIHTYIYAPDCRWVGNEQHVECECVGEDKHHVSIKCLQVDETYKKDFDLFAQ